jgi:hypothetical protein
MEITNKAASTEIQTAANNNILEEIIASFMNGTLYQIKVDIGVISNKKNNAKQDQKSLSL